MVGAAPAMWVLTSHSSSLPLWYPGRAGGITEARPDGALGLEQGLRVHKPLASNEDRCGGLMLRPPASTALGDLAIAALPATARTPTCLGHSDPFCSLVTKKHLAVAASKVSPPGAPLTRTPTWSTGGFGLAS